MTRQQALAALCRLQEEVYNTGACDGAADCFCGKGGFWSSPDYKTGDYRNDGEAVEFIIAATRHALAHKGLLQRFTKAAREAASTEQAERREESCTD